MTDNERDTLIERMIDAPEALTAAELDAISADGELLELYEAQAALSTAMRPEPRVDVEREWALVRPLLRQRPSLTRRVMRVAAIFVGVMVLGGVAYRVLDSALTQADGPAAHEGCGGVLVALLTPPGEREESAESPAPMPAAPAAGFAADEAAEAEVEECLRLQRARAESEVAIATADVIMEQYAAMRELYYDGAAPEDFYDEDIAIQTITMI